MSLRQKQSDFARAVAHLILRAYDLGFEVTLGDCYRDSRCPYGSPSSKHHRRLAVDLNLFKDGVYLSDSDSHKPLGEWWESTYAHAIWGGRWDMADGNHYEWAD